LGSYSQTTANRASVFLEVAKGRIWKLMLAIALDQTHAKLSMVTLVPNLIMKKGKEGRRQYSRLVRKYDPQWAEESVRVLVVTDPGHEILIYEQRGRRHLPSYTEWVPGFTEIRYEFLREGTTLEKLEWTVALGNKPTVKIGPLTKAYKEGLPRNAHKKK
jgi:hypothetical protein